MQKYKFYRPVSIASKAGADMPGLQSPWERMHFADTIKILLMHAFLPIMGGVCNGKNKDF
jgi:hypothetical protein